MTIPVSDDVNSPSGLLFSLVDELRDLPHIKNFTEITALWTSLKKQRPGSWRIAQEDVSLQNLQKAVLNASSLAAKWKKARLRLLFESSTFGKELRNAFRDILKSFHQMQVVPSRYQIVEHLDKVIEDLSDGAAWIVLNNAETEFKKQFFDFLRENRSKSVTVSVGTWLAEHLDTDVDSIRQELQETKEYEGTFLEELLFYVTELEKRKLTSHGGSGSASDANSNAYHSFDKPLDEVARDGVQKLSLEEMVFVLAGLDDLLECTKTSKGKLEVFKAGAIPEAIRLAKQETGKYIDDVMTLLEALTSSHGQGEEGARVTESRNIYLYISTHLDFLITLMKDNLKPEARLLAAETVVNMLVNSQVWRTVRAQHDIVSALVAIANEDIVDQSIELRNRADHVCVVGLTHLTKFSSERSKLEIKSAGDKTQSIVTALMQLLDQGLNSSVLVNLAKDSLVALDTQVLVMDHRTPPNEVCSLIRSEFLKLMGKNGFISHSTILGRMAIISLMTKLCELDKEAITEDLFLYLLKMIKRTGDETMTVWNSGNEKVKELTKLLSFSVKLLCFCVTHGKPTARAVLAENVEERKTLEEMLKPEQNSGIPDESKLEILEILDQIGIESSEAPTAVGGVAVLVKLANSPSLTCRAQVASRFLKLVQEQQDVTEMQEEGGIDALMDLLKVKNVNCQKDALLTLYLLSRSTKIPTKELNFQIISPFLHTKGQIDVREAAVGLLDLMVKEKAENAKKFMETPEGLKAILLCLDKDAENPSSLMCASALLNMANEDDDSVRLGVASAGLGILVKFVRKHGTVEHKELLTTTLSLLCQKGNGCEEAVTKAGGHTFLLTSLAENIAKEAAAQGLLSLIDDVGEVLQAGFVTTAMGSIDRKFASTEMALALARISSTSDGLDQIVASPRSVGALLLLLDCCPTLEGKGAAAAVIAKLYPRLNSDEDLKRMTEACPLLLKYLDEEDKSQLKEFLMALAAFATGRKGRQRIHEDRGQTPLIRYLKTTEIDIQVRDLVLKILAEMSSVFLEVPGKRDSSYHKNLNVFLDNKIGELLCPLPLSDTFKQNTESMKNLLILIRNLSLAGHAAVSHLSENGAVSMLLNVLKDHDTSLSPVTELAVKALVKFMDEPNGKKAFLNGGGIKSLVAVLKLDATGTSDVKSITTIILASVAQDPRTGKVACESIFSCNILQSLNNIMYDGESSRIKWQAAVLMKLLVTYGPTPKVCAAMNQYGSLDALSSLRSVEHCEEIATDVLRFVRGKNSECRRYIDFLLNRPR